MDNDYRGKLKQGQNLVGMMHFTGSPMMIEVMATAGCDFVNIDMEHSPIGIESVAHLIRAAEAAGITPFVRVPSVDAALIKKILNLGAKGIIIPHATRDTCLAAVDAARYEPEGSRGSCPAIRASRYSQPDWAEFTRLTNRDVTVIPLLEEKEVVEDADAILAIDGIDIVFLGPFDFSISLGIPDATFDHPVMARALDQLVEKARNHGKYVMTSVGAKINDQYARMIYAHGVRLISYSADALVFLEACRQVVATRVGTREPSLTRS
jgi:4-hydroxy-2-oxoheptanedioate aldolase